MYYSQTYIAILNGLCLNIKKSPGGIYIKLLKVQAKVPLHLNRAQDTHKSVGATSPHIVPLLIVGALCYSTSCGFDPTCQLVDGPKLKV